VGYTRILSDNSDNDATEISSDKESAYSAKNIFNKPNISSELQSRLLNVDKGVTSNRNGMTQHVSANLPPLLDYLRTRSNR
jgi:hypothetical protein